MSRCVFDPGGVGRGRALTGVGTCGRGLVARRCLGRCPHISLIPYPGGAVGGRM